MSKQKSPTEQLNDVIKQANEDGSTNWKEGTHLLEAGADPATAFQITKQKACLETCIEIFVEFCLTPTSGGHYETS